MLHFYLAFINTLVTCYKDGGGLKLILLLEAKTLLKIYMVKIRNLTLRKGSFENTNKIKKVKHKKV